MNSGQLSKVFLVSALVFLVAAPEKVFAHCDGLDGPVVKAAQAALQSSNVNLVLPWVKKDDEQIIRQAFTQALEVRKLSPSAKELADRYFFETIVRIHRAGEGAPYTGLKPAGRDLGPAIPSADKAIEQGSTKDVEKLLTDTLSDGIHEHFQMLIKAKNYDKNNVEAGREYVEHYVTWFRYINGIYQAMAAAAAPHGEEEAAHLEHEE
ncbi:MAG: hypothetical protein IT292_03220 [Deltaproteobacteria bacterium]|nr:hypothetical protein [Deltaproteobacteria bacterium]